MESRARAQRANGDCLCCKRVGVLQCLCYKRSSSPITVTMTTRQLNVKVLLLLLLLLLRRQNWQQGRKGDERQQQ